MKSPQSTLTFAAGWLLVPLLTIGSPPAQPPPDNRPPAHAEDRARNQDLLQIVAETLKTLDESDNKPFYYSRTLGYIAEAQVKLGDREAAKATLRRAARLAAAANQAADDNSRGLPRAYQLWEVGHSQLQLGDKEAAMETLRLALKARDEQNSNYFRVMTLARIAREFTGLGAHDEALKAVSLADIHHAAGGGRDDEIVVPEVAAAHAAAGDIDGAFGVLDRVVAGAQPLQVKQFVIGRALGKIAEAVEMADRATIRAALDRVRRRLDTMPDSGLKDTALIEIPLALARIGDFEEAMQAASLNPGPHRAVAAMLRIAGVQNQAGDREGARKTLHEAYETAKRAREPFRSESRLDYIASGMIDSGDLDGAWRCVDDLKPGERSETLAKIAVSQRKRGDQEAADKTFRRALLDARSRHGVQPRSDEIPKAIAKVQAMMGDYDAARKATDGISDPISRATTLAEIARAQAAAGDARGALEWCRKHELPPKTQNPLESVIQGIGDFADALAKGAP